MVYIQHAQTYMSSNGFFFKLGPILSSSKISKKSTSIWHFGTKLTLSLKFGPIIWKNKNPSLDLFLSMALWRILSFRNFGFKITGEGRGEGMTVHLPKPCIQWCRVGLRPLPPFFGDPTWLMSWSNTPKMENYIYCLSWVVGRPILCPCQTSNKILPQAHGPIPQPPLTKKKV